MNKPSYDCKNCSYSENEQQHNTYHVGSLYGPYIGPPLSRGQQNAGAYSENNTQQNVDLEQWNLGKSNP